MEIFWKIYVNNSSNFFEIISSYFVVWIFHSYISTKSFWKIDENNSSNFKLFCDSDFPSLYIHETFLKKLWKQFNWFFKNLKRIFHSYIFIKIVWKILRTKNIVFKTKLDDLIRFLKFIFSVYKTNKIYFIIFVLLNIKTNKNLCFYI